MRSLRGDWERGDKIRGGRCSRGSSCSSSSSGSRYSSCFRCFFGGGIDFCEKMLYICREIDLLEF